VHVGEVSVDGKVSIASGCRVGLRFVDQDEAPVGHTLWHGGAELVHAGLELSLVLGSGTALETQRFTLESKE
jgi:hypothetical protein